MSELPYRPRHVPYPCVWLTFQAPDENGQLSHFRIQDLPEERGRDAVNHLRTYYLTAETVCRARNMASDEASVDDFKYIWREAIYDEGLSLACFKEGSNELVAVNVLYVEEKDAKLDWEDYDSQNVKDMDLVSSYLLDQFNIYDHYQVDYYLADCGLSVLPKYRRRGIALKMLEARKLLGQACGLKLTSNIVFSKEAQRLAERAGYEKNIELSFLELAQKSPNYAFNVSPENTISVYKRTHPVFPLFMHYTKIAGVAAATDSNKCKVKIFWWHFLTFFYFHRFISKLSANTELQRS
ncbi:hypothetical protein Bhyg_17307 [Pseudolycoriella hygida]|uniref:N-acetyltransferase domain-containing protein n=1 Tax=Pseudolycoriella hygida TaxID=35572 RepID=A0A9Q0MJU7_9DIPT|nr:hypothetical protein Bhyg_17307 [Pseudolycoriella hygida]